MTADLHYLVWTCVLTLAQMLLAAAGAIGAFGSIEQKQRWLPRLARGVMVGLHYARQMTTPPRLPLFVDSGGFAAIFQTSVVREERELGVLDVRPAQGVLETLTPMSVLECLSWRGVSTRSS